MKRLSSGELGAALPIVLPGSVAAAIVVRSLLAYWGRDRLAVLIVVAIGAALAIGLAELLARRRRAQRLDRELRGLPTTATESTLQAASPQLAALLRARLEQSPLPGLGESITPFLTGLLVMLGLLGTLLGLFQTVHGAGQALTTSSDVDALRRSLSAPIAGLTRSFGCSAAGISASAMLGLALALVRRAEARLLHAVSAYAAGPLRALSPANRQLRALERLVEQGSAMPDASRALESVGAKLADLSTELVSLQRAALEGQRQAFLELLAKLHTEFSQLAGDLGHNLDAAIAPAMERLVRQSGETLAAHAATVVELARDTRRELERDAAERREREAERLAALDGLTARFGSELESLCRAVQAQLEQRVTAEHNHDERAQRALLQLQAASTAVEHAAGQAFERVGQSAGLLDESITRQGASLTALIARVSTLVPELSAAAQSGVADLHESLRRSSEAQAERFAAFEAALERAREEHALGLSNQLDARAERLEEQLGNTSHSVQEAAAIWRASSAEMQTLAELFASSIERHREASAAWLASLGEVEAAVERAGQNAASDALAQQLTSTQELFARQLQFQRELFEQLRALRSNQTRAAHGERDVSV